MAGTPHVRAPGTRARRILILTDHRRTLWRSWLSEVDQADVLVLKGGTDEHRSASAWSEVEHVSYLDAEAISRAAEPQVREFYPGFVDRFGNEPLLAGRAIVDLFPRRASASTWWFMEATEKSPLRGRISRQLHWVAMTRVALDSTAFDECWVDVSEPEMTLVLLSGQREIGPRFLVAPPLRIGALKSRARRERALLFPLRLLAYRVYAAARAVGAKLALTGIGAPRPAGGSRTLALYTRFPVLWTSSLDPSRATERYFLHLEKGTGEKIPLVYAADVSAPPTWLLRHRARLRTVFRQRRIRPLLKDISWARLITILAASGTCAAYWRFSRRSREVQIPFVGFDVAPAWDREVRRSISGIDGTNALVLAACAEGVDPEAVTAFVHPLEFQPIERALWVGSRVPTAGFQHASFSGNLFNYFFDQAVIARALSGEDEDGPPLPDLLLANGTAARDAFLAAGFPSDRVELVGALRYNDLRSDTPAPTQRATIRKLYGLPANEKLVLVLTTSDAPAARALLGALKRICEGGELGARLIFRCHYHAPLEREVDAWFGARPESLGLAPAEAPLHELVTAADVVLTGYSTVSLEATILGVPTIIFRDPGSANLDPLVDYEALASFATTSDRLEEVLHDMLVNPPDLTQRGPDLARLEREVFYRLDGQAPRRTLDALAARGWAPGERLREPARSPFDTPKSL